VICWLRVVITAASDRTAAAQAAVTSGGWASCGLRSAARIAAVLSLVQIAPICGAV